MMSKKKNKTSVKYLPVEILTLILVRMPAKSLLRFRSVCKPWRSIIDDPDFVHLHLQLCNMNNNPKNKLFVVYYDRTRYNCDGKRFSRFSMEIRRADTFRKTGHKITSFKNYVSLGSCNGLILLRRCVCIEEELILWNPSIRKSVLIPPCPIPPGLHHITKFVFGYAPSTKEHKILAITVNNTPVRSHPTELFFTVFTLSDQRWTARNNSLINVEGSCLKSIYWSYLKTSNSVFFQGAVHTIGKNLYKDNKDHLVSLDFDSEKFTFMELPYDTYTLRFPLIVGESVGVFNISEENNASIWALKRDGGNKVWTLLFSEPSSRAVFEFKALIKNGLTTKVFYYESDHGDCLIIGKKSYHLASGVVQERGKFLRKHVELETYLESLVLHKGYGAQDDADVFPVN